MKRRILCIVTALVLLSVAFSALATTMVGPNVYVSLATATKLSSTTNIGLTLSEARVENTELWIWLWTRHNTTGEQSSGSYRIYDGDTGVQSRVEHVNEEYTVVGDSYTLRVRSHPDSDIGEKSIISASKFVP